MDLRWKTTERYFAANLQRAAGPVTDPALAALVSETGRVGQYPDLQFDVLVGQGRLGLVGEAKRLQKFLSAAALKALLQIDAVGQQWNRTPVLCFHLADDVPMWHASK